jgi:hypothetical protein
MKAHGLWRVSRVRNVVVQTNCGTANIEGVLAAFAEVKAEMPHSGDWAMLVNSLHWEMSPADALKEIGKCRRWMFDNRCVCSAVIVSPGMRKIILAGHANGEPQGVLQYFDALESACEWLTRNGFPIAKSEYPHAAFVLEATKEGR